MIFLPPCCGKQLRFGGYCYTMEILSQDEFEGIIRLLSPRDVVRMRVLDKTVKEKIDVTTYGNFLRQASVNKITSRNNLHIFAITQAEICVLEWLGNTQGNSFFVTDLTTAAAEFGKLDRLIWLRANACPWNSSLCSSAARGGHLDVIQWAVEHGCSLRISTFQIAVEYSRLDILEWLLCRKELQCTWNESCTKISAQNGDLATLKWCVAKG